MRVSRIEDLEAAKGRLESELRLARKQGEEALEHGRKLKQSVDGERSTLQSVGEDMAILQQKYSGLGEDLKTTQSKLESSQKIVDRLREDKRRLLDQLRAAEQMAADKQKVVGTFPLAPPPPGHPPRDRLLGPLAILPPS